MKTMTAPLYLTLAALMAIVSTAKAQVIFTHGTFTDTSILSTTGTTANEQYGADFGAGPTVTTGNGYLFTTDGSSSPGGTGSNADITLMGDIGNYGAFLNGTTTGDSNFDSVVGTGNYGNSVGNITLNNLTPGLTYEALLLTDDDRAVTGGGDVTITDGSQTSPVQNDFFPDGTGSPSASDPGSNEFEGAFITDRFTVGAGQATHSFTVNGAYINAILVEKVSTPEPSSYALLAIGLGALVWAWRYRSARS